MPSFNEPSTSYDSIFPLSNCMLAVPDILLLSIVSVHVPWLPVIPEVPTSVTYQILPAARAGALMATKIAAAFRARFIILSPHFDGSSDPRCIWSKERAWLARRRPKGLPGEAPTNCRRRFPAAVGVTRPAVEWDATTANLDGREPSAGVRAAAHAINARGGQPVLSSPLRATCRAGDRRLHLSPSSPCRRLN